MVGLSPSRRGLLQGASGLAAAVLVGCPKPAPPPPVSLDVVLTGFDITEASVSKVLRAMNGAPASLVLQRRTTHTLRRTLTGPASQQDFHQGAVLRVQRDGLAEEWATSRSDEDAIGVLLDRAGLKAPPLAAAPSTEDAPATGPSPVAEPAPDLAVDLPSLDVVGAGLALLFESLRADSPLALAAAWEQVEDTRLVVISDGRLLRQHATTGRLVVEADFLTPAGRRTILRRFGPEVFSTTDLSGDGVEAVVQTLRAAAALQGEAAAPEPYTGTVVLDAPAALEVLVAAGALGWRLPVEERPIDGHPELDDSGGAASTEVWAGQKRRRTTVESPRIPVPRALHPVEALRDAGPSSPAAREVWLSAPVHVTAAFGGGALVLRPAAAEYRPDGAARALVAGSTVRIPKEALEGLSLAGPPPEVAQRGVVGGIGEGLLVMSGLPALRMSGCTVEAPRVGS